MRVLLLFPAWPTNLRPNGYPFLSEQAYAVSEYCDARAIALLAIPHVVRPQYWSTWLRDRRVFPLRRPDGHVPVALAPVLLGPLLEPLLDTSPINVRSVVRQAQRLFDGASPDVVHAHFMEPCGLLVRQVAQELGCPYVITEHAAEFVDYSQLGSSRFRDAAFGAEAFICVSEPLARDTRAAVGDDLDIQVIPNGVDVTRFSPGAGKNNDPNKPRLLFVGHLEHRKGVDLLLQALDMRKRGRRPTHLTIVGDGPERPRLEAFATDAGLKDSVHFTGICRNEEMPAYFHNHDIFVLPSRRESFGVVVIEALACGLPVIVTRCGGPETIVTPSDGSVIAVDDVIGLRTAIDDMATRLRDFDPIAMSRRVRNLYSWSNVAPRICSVLEESARPRA
jgi:L-malate glycosyltransferase